MPVKLRQPPPPPGVYDGEPVVYIALTRGQVAMIDAKNADLAQFNWQANKAINGMFYAYRSVHAGGKQRQVGLHRVVLERKLGRPLVRGEQPDHENRITLDNRESNIRLASVSNNAQNRSQPVGPSGYRVVKPSKESSRWMASIKPAHGRAISLGTFDSSLEAAVAYDMAAMDLHGEFALTNYPRVAYPENPLIVVQRSQWQRAVELLKESPSPDVASARDFRAWEREVIQFLAEVRR